MGSFGVLAPLPELDAGAGEAEDGALGRGGALAGLPELVLFMPGVFIGGLDTFGRFWPCPVKVGRITVGAGFSTLEAFTGCDATFCCGAT